MPGEYESRFAEGVALAERGAMPEAANLFDDLARAHPARHEAFIQLGLMADAAGDVPGALEKFRRAVELAPTDADALFNLGVAHGKASDWAAAARVFEALVAAHPDHKEAREKLGWLYWTLGRTDEVTGQLARARELASGNPQALIDLGTSYARMHQLAAAVECYQAAVALNPAKTEVRKLLGMALCDVNRPDEALRHFEVLVKRMPTDAAARRLLADTYLGTGKTIEAAEAYRIAYKLEPGDEAALGLSTALFLQGRHAEARACLPRVAGEGDLTVFHHGPASAWAGEGSGDYREVREASTAPDGRVLQPFILHTRETSILSGEWPVFRGGELLFDQLVHNPRQYPGRSAYFALSSPDHGLVRIPRARMQVEQPAVLVGSTGNYYHWFLDHAARLMLLEDEPACAGLPIIVGSELASYERDTLDRLGYPAEKRIGVPRETVCECRDLWIPSLVTQRTIPHPRAVSWLRERLARPGSQPTRRLFVSRADASWRRIMNEEEVEAVLLRHGFEKVVLGGMTLDQQIDLFAQAQVVVGGHGAGLANMLFAPASAQLLELSSHSYPAEFFSALARTIGQTARRLNGPIVGAQSRMPHLWDFTIEARELEDSLKDLLGAA